MAKLSDAQLRAWMKKRPTRPVDVPDGAVSGLWLRLGPYTMTWSLRLRVKGEGGVSRRGRQRNGKSHRVTLGEYPVVTLEAARSPANAYLDQAKHGMSPVAALERAATAGGLTVQELATVFMEDYAKMRGIRSLKRYSQAIEVHIVPRLGEVIADPLTRDQLREAATTWSMGQPSGRPAGIPQTLRLSQDAGGLSFFPATRLSPSCHVSWQSERRTPNTEPP